jgi:hypothetical protein
MYGVRGSVVGIVTRYGLDGPGPNPGKGQDFPISPEGAGSFPRVKRLGLVADIDTLLVRSLRMCWSYTYASFLRVHRHIMG